MLGGIEQVYERPKAEASLRPWWDMIEDGATAAMIGLGKYVSNARNFVFKIPFCTFMLKVAAYSRLYLNWQKYPDLPKLTPINGMGQFVSGTPKGTTCYITQNTGVTFEATLTLCEKHFWRKSKQPYSTQLLSIFVPKMLLKKYTAPHGVMVASNVATRRMQ